MFFWRVACESTQDREAACSQRTLGFARLRSSTRLFRAMSHYNDDALEALPKRINDVINETTVPIWVRMEKYKAAETKAHPTE